MAEEGNKLVNFVIPWLTGFIWRESPGGVARCRGCGSKLLTGQDAYRYIYGWFKQTAQRGYLCPECGEAVLQAIIEKAAQLLPVEQCTATISVRGGQVKDVTGLPPAWCHDVADYDNCSVCGGLDDDCENCRWPDGPAWSGDG